MLIHAIQTALISGLEFTAMSFLVTMVLAFIPQAAKALAMFIETNKALHRNAVVNGAVAEAIAYFKAHEQDFSAKGVSMVDYACDHLQGRVPGMDRLAAEHAVQLFLSTLADNLH